MRVLGICAGRRTCCDRVDVGSRRSAGVGRGATCDSCAPGIVQGVGWLWLGLASGARTLEPVERGMGSAALCAEPLLRGLEPLCGVVHGPFEGCVITAAGEARTGGGVGPTAHNLWRGWKSPAIGRVHSSVDDTSLLWAINVPRRRN